MPPPPASFFYRRDITLDEITWGGDSDAVLGYSPQQLPAGLEGWLALIHPDDRADAERSFAQFFACRGALRQAYRVRIRDGAWRRIADEAVFLGGDVVIGSVRWLDAATSSADDLQGIIDAIPVAILLAAANGTISFANHRAHACFGYPPGGLPGVSMDALLPHPGPPSGHNQRLLVGHRGHGRRMDGTTVPVAISHAPFAFRGTLQVAWTVLDLTELSQNERDLERFFDLSLDLFCIARLDGFFARVNPNFSRLLGHADNDLLSRPYLDFVHPDDREATLREVAKLSSGLPVVQFRNRYRDSRAEYHWLEWTARSVPEEGTIFAAARDVTERAHMEEELVSRERRERAILDNTPAVIYIKGADGRYQFVNQRHAQLFSLDRDAVVGKSVHEIFPPDVADRLMCNDRQVIELKATITTQEIVPHADGDHIYISVKCPLFDTAGQVTAVAGISTDFTEQIRARQAEEELRLARSFQRKLYPSRAPTVAGLDVAGSAVPVTQMCGDYFDYVQFDERRLAVSLGDVSGHGLGPALEMVEIRTASRFLLGRGTELADTLHELNQMLCDDLPESSFVSLFLAEVDVGGNRLRYLGAGHDAFLIRASGEVARLDSTHSLLGIDRSLTFSEVASVPMGPGDLLFLFTDGLTDAMSVTGEPFGRRRATQAVSRHRWEPAERILQDLYLAVYEFTSGRSPDDDMTAIVVKLVGPE